MTQRSHDPTLGLPVAVDQILGARSIDVRMVGRRSGPRLLGGCGALGVPPGKIDCGKKHLEVLGDGTQRPARFAVADN